MYLMNKVALITGGTRGIGLGIARCLAAEGYDLALNGVRDPGDVDSVLQNLRQTGVDVIYCQGNIADEVARRSVIDEIKKSYGRINVLVNNAGVMALVDQATEDGYDVQMQTNVLSHFLLTKDLFPLLKNSKQARIVNHSSMARLGGPLEMKYFEKNGGNLGGDGTEAENTSFQGPRWERYHQTKLANACFTYGLKEKLEAKNMTHVLALLAHPGLALTNLQVTTAADGGMDGNSELMNQAQSAEDGATGIIRASMDPEAKSGDFYGPTAGWKGFPDLLPPEDLLTDESNLRINWEGCEKAVGEFVF